MSSDNGMNRFPVDVSWGSILWYDGGHSDPKDSERYDGMVCGGGTGEGADAWQGELMSLAWRDDASVDQQFLLVILF